MCFFVADHVRLVVAGVGAGAAPVAAAFLMQVHLVPVVLEGFGRAEGGAADFAAEAAAHGAQRVRSLRLC